jgi:hypothetical protein
VNDNGGRSRFAKHGDIQLNKYHSMYMQQGQMTLLLFLHRHFVIMAFDRHIYEYPAQETNQLNPSLGSTQLKAPTHHNSSSTTSAAIKETPISDIDPYTKSIPFKHRLLCPLPLKSHTHPRKCFHLSRLPSVPVHGVHDHS